MSPSNTPSPDLPLGIIEGFFGAPWPDDVRMAMIPRLSDLGISTYVYAPKSDRRLREGWETSHSPDQMAVLKALSVQCRANAIAFGVGLSPFELYTSDIDEAVVRLVGRVTELMEPGVDVMAILFDDMRGDVEDLAASQVTLVNAVRRALPDTVRVVMCPSYYTTDPVLDRVFGARPQGYLEDLGRGLHPDVDVFWTGPKVCSEHYPASHLVDVAKALRRRPLIWDNYPVNDGPKMCKSLHLAAFNDRHDLVGRTRGVMINPMNQAWLSLLPISSLVAALAGVGQWQSVFPPALQANLARDCALFKEGLDAMTTDDIARLVAEYSQYQHPAAAEVISWLHGETIVGPECLTND